MRLGVLCGYGILEHFSEGNAVEWTEENRFGKVEGASVSIGEGIEVVFRHGKAHQHYPHKVPYRANALALKEKGVEAVLCIYAMGYCAEYRTGDLILLDDFICFAPYRSIVEEGEVQHYSVYPAFDEQLKNNLVRACEEEGIEIKEGGVAHTIAGPRFETATEVRAIQSMGANLLSMTCGFEIPLFHELHIPVVGLAIATNPGSGMKGHVPSHREVEEMMREKMKDVARIAARLAHY